LNRAAELRADNGGCNDQESGEQETPTKERGSGHALSSALGGRTGQWGSAVANLQRRDGRVNAVSRAYGVIRLCEGRRQGRGHRAEGRGEGRGHRSGGFWRRSSS
jgi:hypothetical protein